MYVDRCMLSLMMYNIPFLFLITCLVNHGKFVASFVKRFVWFFVHIQPSFVKWVAKDNERKRCKLLQIVKSVQFIAYRLLCNAFRK